MKFPNNTDDDDNENLYNGFEPDEPKKPKEPDYPVDDPRYWDKDEGNWDHLKPSSFTRRVLIWGGAAATFLLILGFIAYWLLTPYVDDAVQYGYIDHIEKRGDIFKTFEGNMLPYKSLHDTTRTYEGDFIFSTSNKIGEALFMFQKSGRPLRVEYRTYRYAMPWRGDSRTVIVRVDTVSPDSILPLPRVKPPVEPPSDSTMTL